jgi:hypothetical protein
VHLKEFFPRNSCFCLCSVLLLKHKHTFISNMRHRKNKMKWFFKSLLYTNALYIKLCIFTCTHTQSIFCSGKKCVEQTITCI